MTRLFAIFLQSIVVLRVESVAFVAEGKRLFTKSIIFTNLELHIYQFKKKNSSNYFGKHNFADSSFIATAVIMQLLT